MLLKHILSCKQLNTLISIPCATQGALSVKKLIWPNLSVLSFNGDINQRTICTPSKSLHHLTTIFDQKRNILEPSSVLQLPNRRYAMRLELSEYGIIWKRPEHIPKWKPEISGDLLPFEDIDKTQPVVSLLNIANDIAKADEKTQRMLSLEFSSNKEVWKMAKYRMKRRIQRHKYDEDSPEVKIAIMTVNIRYFQKVVAENKKLVRLRVRLQELIDKRNCKLRKLRRLDYKRFEWLLEELGIVYKPFPRNCWKPTRKRALRTLVTMHCRKIREEKLEKYRMELEILKKPFLEEKRQTLQWIAETEKKLGLPISVEVPEEKDSNLNKSSCNETSLSVNPSN